MGQMHSRSEYPNNNNATGRQRLVPELTEEDVIHGTGNYVQ